MHAYPLDTLTKEKEPFWRLPKRAPNAELGLDINNNLHIQFVAAMTALYAKTYGVEIPFDFRSKDWK